MKAASEFQPQRILIVLHGSIGDVTRALPLAAMLRRAFPSAFLAWSVEPLSYPLLEHNPAIDEIIVFERRWKGSMRFLLRIRARRFDLVLDLQRLFKSGLISRWSGARHRVGFHRRDSKEFNWLFNNRRIPRYGDGVSKLEHYLRFADYLGIRRGPIKWHFELSAGEKTAVEGLLSGVGAYGVLFVGTRWQSKDWFPHQMADCAELLARDFGLATVLLGGKDDHAVAAQAAGQVSMPITNLTGKTSLRQAIGVIQRAKIAIGPDTGLMHIAAAVGTPVVSLWGATDPVRTGPHGNSTLVIRGQAPCAPCYRRSCSIGRICMQSISTAQIGAKLRAALDPEAESRVSDGR